MDLYLAECKVWKNVFPRIHFIQATKNGEILKKNQFGLLFEDGSGDPFVIFNTLPISDITYSSHEFLSRLDDFGAELKMHPDDAFQLLPILQKSGFPLNKMDPGYFIFNKIATHLMCYPIQDYIAHV